MAAQDPSQILSEYGADALRLYLVNSPVVHAETLRFKKEGVFGVVKDVFLPWYNAYRFLVQNVLRLEADSGQRFDPSQVLHFSCFKPAGLLSISQPLICKIGYSWASK